MATLYVRKRSPYFWFRPNGGKARSTKLRTNVPAEIMQAQDMLEAERAKERAVFTDRERWEHWVPRFIGQKYEESPKSLERYRLRWRSIRGFLLHFGITHPRKLSFEMVDRYLEWRRAGNLAYGVRACHKNTAIGDLKFLGLLMKQAVRLGYAPVNPCSSLGLVKTKPEPKPEITDEHLRVIWRELQQEPVWMAVSFQIALYTGCRLRETIIPLDCVDVKKKLIHFPQTKGNRSLTVPMRDELVPLFRRLIDEGRTVTLSMPALPSKAWWLFFKRVGLSQYCFHSTRVSFISRGARAGVPMSEMRAIVGHASDEIHRIYLRFQPRDLRKASRKIPLPDLDAAIHGKPETQGAPRSSQP